jgi:hypothetical protein
MYLGVVLAVVFGEVARVGMKAAVGIDFLFSFDSAAPGLALQYLDAVWLAVRINLVHVSSGACPLANNVAALVDGRELCNRAGGGDNL